MPVVPLTAHTFQRRLLSWFDAHGRKHLPWQQHKTPYRVWISEIMLQQTQVGTVIPYFQHFIQRFPDVLSLAKAPLDDVLHLWAGLGYYSRARNLHQAAVMIAEQYQGRFPDTKDTLQTLPGIGRSTAGAILALAFEQPGIILDGNVKRVLARLHGLTQPINDKTTEQTLWALAENYTPVIRAADYTQAMMDLGATVCTRSKPACLTCPFLKNCTAYHHHLTACIPQKRPAKKIPTQEATFLILKRGRHVLLCKRPTQGIWGGLYCLPEIAGLADSHTVIQYCQQQFKLLVSEPKALNSFRHTFSHYHLQIHPIMVQTKKAPTKLMESTQQILYNLSKPLAIGLPKPIQTILEALR